MAVNLPDLPDVERLSTNIIRVMGGNPSKYTLQGSNTYILGSGSQRILLDTGQGLQAWRANLSTALQKYHCSISQCLLSHWHHDHLGGVRDLIELSAPTSPPTIHKHQPFLDPDNLIVDFLPSSSSSAKQTGVIDIRDGEKFSTAGLELKALYTPGHTADHMCFLITGSSDQSEIGCIFTADNVLGHGTAVFEDLDAYVASLKLMHSAVSAPSSSTDDHAAATASGTGTDIDKSANTVVKAYPGHGQVIDDAAAKIHEYLEHRRMREEEVLNLLKLGSTKAPEKSGSSSSEGQSEVEGKTKAAAAGGASDDISSSSSSSSSTSTKEWGSMEIVKVIYQHYPEALHIPAEGGVKHVLRKLLKEGKVVYREETEKWKAAFPFPSSPSRGRATL